MSFTKIIFNAKPRSLKYANEHFHHLWRVCFTRCLRLVLANQVCKYATKHNENVIYPIDPKVKAVQDRILYSEYLSYEKMRVGFVKRVKIRKKLEEIEKKQRIKDQLEKSVYSVTLNHITKDISNDSFIKRKAKVSNLDDRESQAIIHMPYASTDSFKVVDVSTDKNKDISLGVDDADKSHLSLLNKNYKALYEKYLKLKSLTHGRKKQTFIEYEEAYNGEKLEDLQKVPDNWMEDYEHYDDSQNPSDWLYGTADTNSNISSIPCGGCGSLLHCKDRALPGYLPSELFLSRTNEELKVMTCQRCHFMKHYNTALEVKVSPEDYPELLKVIKTKKCAVILMIDVTDFPCSIWPNIGSVLHPRTPVFLVGNKIDLLPKDSPQFEMHAKECISKTMEMIGIEKNRIRHIALISAKTGYGVEELINKLYKLWKYKGDVYVIGCTNVGKSSLFNILLQSDYCKVQAADLVQRATTSPWPGTTLNLLKFPITNPVRWRLYLRAKRLQAEQEGKLAAQYIKNYQLQTLHDIEYGTLQGFIGRTFTSRNVKTAQSLDIFSSTSHKSSTGNSGLDETDPIYKDSCWCYDTPGTIQSDQILDLLTTEELIATLPNKIISPRTFFVKPRQTMFIGGLGRLDYLEGTTFIRCTVFASDKLPITMCHFVDADDLYEELLHTEAFVVPINNSKRLKVWPSLQPKQMEITGISETESAADVVLSNAGWIAVTPNENEQIKVQGWTPDARGIYLRIPALLKKSVTLRGTRVPGTPVYKKGRQIYVKNF